MGSPMERIGTKPDILHSYIAVRKGTFLPYPGKEPNRFSFVLRTPHDLSRRIKGRAGGYALTKAPPFFAASLGRRKVPDRFPQ